VMAASASSPNWFVVSTGNNGTAEANACLPSL